jgi:predicted metal-binding membrane protein
LSETVLDGPLERALQRDRTLIAISIGLLTGLSWLYLWWLSARMGAAPEMAGMAGMGMSDMPGMVAPGFRPWFTADLAFNFSMWSVMMVGMMLPSAAPIVLLHARVARQATAQSQPFAGPAWFVAGYLLAWCGFSAIATLAQFLLERAALLTPMLASNSHVVGGGVLNVTGISQWTPMKDACLTQCQSPLSFIQRYGGFQGTRGASLAMGARHGAYCVGCCWALMSLLFVGGVMNLLWIAGITVFVLLEKGFVRGPWLSRVAGVAAILAGVWVIELSR